MEWVCEHLCQKEKSKKKVNTYVLHSHYANTLFGAHQLHFVHLRLIRVDLYSIQGITWCGIYMKLL